MKTLYLDCGMGAAGDMLSAALMELLPDPDGFVAKVQSLGIPGVEVKKEKSVKCGITGTHYSVLVHGEEEESLDAGGHEHHHDHDGHAHSHDSGDEYGLDHYHEHGHEHDQDCEHEHSHNHFHDHEEEHGHEHNHNHTHEHHHHHHHSSMHDIEHIVSDLHLPAKAEKDVLEVYRLIAEAESHAHGVPVTEIHFHEVGTMDAVADITTVCLLMNELSPDEVVVSPVCVGFGQVKCAHGILPVPAPATAYILQDVPVYGGEIRGELCTPTGAALIKHFATRFGSMPVMKISKVGYGMGKKDFPVANCVRALFGESVEAEDNAALPAAKSALAGQISKSDLDGLGRDKDADNIMLELACNVDDMTAEEIGFAMDRLFEGGAHEVFTVPVGMKKSRLGTLLKVICKPSDREIIVSLLFKHTTTIGIRETVTQRYVLNRRVKTIETPYGEVRQKISEGYGVTRKKYEFDDLSGIAKEQGISLKEARFLVGHPKKDD